MNNFNGEIIYHTTKKVYHKFINPSIQKAEFSALGQLIKTVFLKNVEIKPYKYFRIVGMDFANYNYSYSYNI